MKKILFLLFTLILLLLMIPASLSSAQSPSDDEEVFLLRAELCYECGKGQVITTITYGPMGVLGWWKDVPEFPEPFWSTTRENCGNRRDMQLRRKSLFAYACKVGLWYLGEGRGFHCSRRWERISLIHLDRSFTNGGKENDEKGYWDCFSFDVVNCSRGVCCKCMRNATRMSGKYLCHSRISWLQIFGLYHLRVFKAFVSEIWHR